MLMTQPELTEQARELLAIVRRWRGEWVNRKDIATAENKTRLNKWDTKLLDDLTEAGLIEARKHPITGPIGYEWQYRAKS